MELVHVYQIIYSCCPFLSLTISAFMPSRFNPAGNTCLSLVDVIWWQTFMPNKTVLRFAMRSFVPFWYIFCFCAVIAGTLTIKPLSGILKPWKGQAQSHCFLGTFVIWSLPQAGVTLFPLCYVQFLCCKRIRLFNFHAMLLQVVMAQGSFWRLSFCMIRLL